ncbi:hypothetical protein LTR23_004405 [Exophiala sp. CCFEE 6169]|nr:hypothetical protein LTR23_004405 [Chaetothyriales sp. CCFEE 6169]
MYVSTLSLLLLTSLTGGWASPLEKRYFDFDNNGVADRCYQIYAAEQTQATSDISTSSSVVQALKSITTSTSSMTASAAISSSTASSSFLTTLTTTPVSSSISDYSTSTMMASAAVSSSTASSSFLTTLTTTPVSSSISDYSTSTITSVTSETSSFTGALLVQRTTGKSSSSTKKASTTSSHSSLPTGTLPSPSQFKADKGDKWTMQYVGDLKFTDTLQKEGLRGDNCRTSKIGDKVIWNCGDMMCKNDIDTCGFSYGPAFYGTDDVMVVNTTDIDYVQSNDFSKPWSGDKAPQAPWRSWGMYSSNVAPINSTHGVVYATQFWRNAPDGSTKARGNTVSSVTLGKNKPIATRQGPLLTGPDAVSLGLLAIMRADDYIYIYSGGGPSRVMVGRVPASDDVFDESNYEFLKADTNDTWIPGIPNADSMEVGATTADPSGQLGCDVWGSVVYNNYLQKYVMLCGLYLQFVNMHTADTPWGPWSAVYQIAGGGNITGSYGAMMHPEYSPGGSGKSWYFSIGPNYEFHMYKVTFDY